MKLKVINSNRILIKIKLLVLIIISILSLTITGILIAQTFTRITNGAIVNDSINSTACHWIDYDNDGDLDISVTTANEQDILVYRNDGNGTFTKIIVGPGINGRGSTWGDYDNDGDLDCFIAVVEKKNNLLYRNDGNDTFTRITTGIVVNDAGNSYGGSWGDYDNDGDLDLFVANGGFNVSQQNFLYNNNGDGTFTKVTTAGSICTDIGKCFNGNWGDYDNDGDLDLFVSVAAPENNRLYKNKGDGTFTRITSGDIVNDSGSIGSSWGDYDNDGDLDLFVASDFRFLYNNNGDSTFTRIADAFTGSDKSLFGSAWGDCDNDGDLDLFLTYSNDKNYLYINEGYGTFSRITTGNIVTDVGISYGCCWGDYENDGDLDLFVANAGFGGAKERNFLYANDGNSNHWINIKCVGTISNTSAIGAKVRVKATIKGKAVWQLNEISALTGGGFGGQNSLNAEFGLDDATIVDSIKVEWPSGRVDYRLNQDADQFITIIEAGDSLALVALYNGTNGTNWINKNNWLSNQPISSWHGITVLDGRVTSIILWQNNLVGIIPPEIGNLTNLINLDLGDNLLSGSISPEISNLKNLINLYLNGNAITGSIPAEIINLTNLKSICIQDNQLSGTIPKSIGNLTNLITLDISTNELSGLIPTEISNLTNLTTLHFGGNLLSGSIPPEIVNLTKLTELWIHNNQFIDLPDLSPINSLKILRIEQNKFTFEDIEPNISVASQTFTYSPQDSVGTRQDTTEVLGSNFTIAVNVGGVNNQYQWYKNGTQISGATNSSYTINQVNMSDAGSYLCKINNTLATALTLYSRSINVTIISDTEPPQITHNAVTTANSGDSLIISVLITDNVSIQSATLYYSKGGASSFNSTEMSNTSGDIWEGSIPASFITERGTEYYIAVSDVSGNTSTYPESEPQSSPLVIQVNFSNLSFTTSTPAMAYQMISVPAYLDNTLPSSVLEDDLGGYNDTQWRLLQYANGTYNEYPNVSNFEPGKGFWLITRDSKSLDTGAGKSVTTAQNYQITLQPGWNQIGNPYAFTVNWSDVIKDGNVESQLVGYSGSSNDGSGYDYGRTQLVPFEGYFVKNNSTSETTIEIPPKSATGSSAIAKHATAIPGIANLQDNEWMVCIKAKSGRYVDKDNYIGVLNSASDEWDSNDFSEAPFFEDLISLYFPHLDWKSYPCLYTGDFRTVTSEGHYWDFNVKTNTSDSEVTLILTQVQNLPPGWEILLLARNTHTSLNFLEREKYTYIPGEDEIERKFRIVVGQSEFIDANDLDLAGIPQNFSLSQNYPNPFNSETRLNYELPKVSDVNIAVFNLNGQLVKTLFAGPQSAGRFVVSWDGKTQDGYFAVSSVYLVQMKAGNFMAVKKILLVE